MSAPSSGSSGAPPAATPASSSTSTLGSSAAASSSDGLATVYREEGLQTGKPVVWEQLEEGYCCVCEGT